jgi:PmbA protein
MKEDLIGLALEIAGRAAPGEEIEAYVSRTRETDVKVFDRGVESLMVAERAGVGVRAIVEGRQGFAWSGSFDLDVVDSALADARDNAEFATPDEFQGVATLDEADGTPAPLDLWSEDLARVPTDAKVALALDVEAAALAADPRVRGVEQAVYGDALTEAAVANSRGVSAAVQRTTCSCAVSALAGEGDETQTGYGFSAGRAFSDLDPGEAALDAATRATRLLGASQTSSRRLPVVFDPLVTRSVLALLGAALSGEAILKGRSVFVGRDGEQVAAAGVTRQRRSHPGRGVRRVVTRFGGRRVEAQRTDRRRRAARLPPQHVHGSPLRHGHERHRRARLLVDPGVRCSRARARARLALGRRGDGRRRRRPLRAVGERLALGDEPRQR